MNTKNLKVAFTLAEVLITLGIIGIVAAMTLPVLMGKYVERERITALKKTYSLLQQAFEIAVVKMERLIAGVYPMMQTVV